MNRTTGNKPNRDDRATRRYRVDCAAHRIVRHSVEVEATSEDEAIAKALAEAGTLGERCWTLDDADRDPPANIRAGIVMTLDADGAVIDELYL